MPTQEANKKYDIENKDPWWRRAMQNIGQFFSNIFYSITSFFYNIFHREPTVIEINNDTKTHNPNQEPAKQKSETEEVSAETQEKNNGPINQDQQAPHIVTDISITESETEQENDGIILEEVDILPKGNENDVDDNVFGITEDSVEPPKFEEILEIDGAGAILEDSFEPQKCETWQDIQESIQRISPAVSIVEAADEKFILKHKDSKTGKINEVLFAMDELNAEGLSECILVPMSIATSIVAQLEINENFINNMIKEKRVNMSVAEMEKVTVQTEYDLLLLAQRCIGKDNISNVSLDNANGELVFKFKSQDCFDKTLRLNLVTLKAEQDVTEMDWNTMRETSTTTELTKSELPVAISALCEVLQQAENREYISKEFGFQEKKHEAEFSVGDEVLEDEDDFGKHKQHKKKGNDRHEKQKAARFEQDIQSGKLPKSKAERAEERRVANSRQRRMEMAAKEDER